MPFDFFDRERFSSLLTHSGQDTRKCKPARFGILQSPAAVLASLRTRNQPPAARREERWNPYKATHFCQFSDLERRGSRFQIETTKMS